MPTIFIAIPTYDRKIDVEIMNTVAQLGASNPKDYSFALDFIGSSIITESRNYLVKRFLETEGATHLYFWDSDIVIRETGFFQKLIETSEKLGADIVGGCYRIKNDSSKTVICRLNDPSKNVVYDLKELTNYKNGEVKEPMVVDCIGNGSMLITRKVLETMPAPWFSFIDEPASKTFPEDYNFCMKAKALGFKTAVDPRFETLHFGSAFWQHRSTDNPEYESIT